VTEGLDARGRPEISNWMKAKIERELAAIPDGKRGALVVIGDEQGARAHLAARIGDRWKVAAGAGVDWMNRKPRGEIAVEYAW
jgi:hypothetical protein